MNNNNNHDKSYSDKLAEIAREAEKDPARNKIDPLENYDIEGPDVREVDPTPIVPVGNPVPGFESQHHAGEVAAVAPIIDASDDHLTEEEAIAAARCDAIDDPDEDLIPLRPDGTDPLTDIDPDEYEEPVEPVEPLDMFDPVDRPLRPDGTMDAPADSDVLASVDPVDPVDPSDRLFENPNGSPRPLSQDEFGVDRPLEDPDRPVGADDVDERPLIERLADAFDGSPDHPTYTRVEDQDVNTPQENLDEYRDGRVADETRYPITEEEIDRVSEPFSEEVDDVEHPIRRVRVDETLPPQTVEDDSLFAPFVEPLPGSMIEDEEQYEDLEYDEEFFEEDEERRGPR